MISRRTILLAPAIGVLAQAAGSAGKMTLSIHQNTSAAAGFRKSLEGWSKAGIKNAEITGNLLDDFLKTDSLAAAGRLITDLGLTPVSGACTVNGLWETAPTRAASLDAFKKRCEQWVALGIPKIYAPTNTNKKITKEDYASGGANMHEVGEIARQYKLTAMVEFTRNSPYISTLTTLLKITREAAHPNLKPMLDFYHFWSGLSKFEDLDLLQKGELGHVHFQDVPDMPRELLDNTTRSVPGEGIAPLKKILRQLQEKAYSGPLSVELFLPEFQQGDPFEVARRIKTKAEAVIHEAKV